MLNNVENVLGSSIGTVFGLCLCLGFTSEELDNIFDSMVSVRQNNPDNRLHFGMGLYVVRVIAEHHGGQVSAVNLLNRRGVTVCVTLSLYREQTEELMAAI